MRRIGLALLLLAPPAVADPVRPGPTADGGTLVVTRQLLHPAGTTLVSGGHPLDLALAPDGKTLFVVNDWSVFPVDTKTMTMGAQLWYGEGGASQHGIAVTPTGKRLFVSVTENTLLEVLVKPDGALDYGRYLALPLPANLPELP